MATERETIILRATRRKYNWPEGPLNLWLLVMLAAGATELGIFTYFMVVQSRLQLGVPWLFPYSISVGSITILFLAGVLFLIQQRQLLPGIVVLGVRMTDLSSLKLSSFLSISNRAPTIANAHLIRIVLHPLRTLPDRSHRNLHPTLRSERQRELLLHAIRARTWPARRRSDARVPRDAGNMQ